MDILDADKLVLFIKFVVPGFISLKTYELLFPGVPKDSSQQLIDAVAYSSINYALLLWPIYLIETNGIRASDPGWYAAFYVFVLLIAPVFWAFLLRKLRTAQFFQGTLQHPTEKPWDYVFGQRRPFWVIVYLKDGKRIGGRYDSQSFASGAPSAEQLYLQEAWEVNSDGGLEKQREGSAGILILASDIVCVEFFNLTKGGEDDRSEKAAEGRLPAGATGPSA